MREARRYHGNWRWTGAAIGQPGPLLMGLDSKDSWESGQSFGPVLKCLTCFYFERTVRRMRYFIITTNFTASTTNTAFSVLHYYHLYFWYLLEP